MKANEADMWPKLTNPKERYATKTNHVKMKWNLKPTDINPKNQMKWNEDEINN